MKKEIDEVGIDFGKKEGLFVGRKKENKGVGFVVLWEQGWD